MEFTFNINDIFKEPVVEINQNLLPPGFSGDRRALWDTVNKTSEIVNAMGEASARAQGLSKPITTAERLRSSENQKLYLLIDQHSNNGKGAVTGMLKTGNKGLYVFDKEGHHYQVSPPCVLDFYVHESRQRNGFGKHLFEHMLQKEEIQPVQMALDRPSDKFLNFLNKYYALHSPVKQMNNFVVFDGFFPGQEQPPAEPEKANTPVKKNSANGLQSTLSSYGRYGAPRPPCSMGQIIHNQTSTINRNQPVGVQSMPATNYQTYTSPHQPTQVSQSTPNMYYNQNNPNMMAANNPQYAKPSSMPEGYSNQNENAYYPTELNQYQMNSQHQNVSNEPIQQIPNPQQVYSRNQNQMQHSPQYHSPQSQQIQSVQNSNQYQNYEQAQYASNQPQNFDNQQQQQQQQQLQYQQNMSNQQVPQTYPNPQSQNVYIPPSQQIQNMQAYPSMHPHNPQTQNMQNAAIPNQPQMSPNKMPPNQPAYVGNQTGPEISRHNMAMNDPQSNVSYSNTNPNINRAMTENPNVNYNPENVHLTTQSEINNQSNSINYPASVTANMNPGVTIPTNTDNLGHNQPYTNMTGMPVGNQQNNPYANSTSNYMMQGVPQQTYQQDGQMSQSMHSQMAQNQPLQANLTQSVPNATASMHALPETQFYPHAVSQSVPNIPNTGNNYPVQHASQTVVPQQAYSQQMNPNNPQVGLSQHNMNMPNETNVNSRISMSNNLAPQTYNANPNQNASQPLQTSNIQGTLERQAPQMYAQVDKSGTQVNYNQQANPGQYKNPDQGDANYINSKETDQNLIDQGILKYGYPPQVPKSQLPSRLSKIPVKQMS